MSIAVRNEMTDENDRYVDGDLLLYAKREHEYPSTYKKWIPVI